MFSQLSALLSDIGLNIREAHVFSTTDGYSLDVFVVDGWHEKVGFLFKRYEHNYAIAVTIYSLVYFLISGTCYEDRICMTRLFLLTFG